MSIINSGQSLTITISANEACRLTASGKAMITVLSGANWNTAEQSITLENGNNYYEFLPFESIRKINITSLNGVVEYNFIDPYIDDVQAVYGKDNKIVNVINRSGSISQYDINYNMPLQLGPASVRGVAHRGGFPSGAVGAQNMSPSFFPIEPCKNPRLLFIGAFTRQETPARAGSIQAEVELPYGSGNWIQVTFNAVATGTFNQNGTVPDESNNFFLLESDPFAEEITELTTVRALCSSNGTFPTMAQYDGAVDGRASLEWTIQNQSTNLAALQLSNLTRAQKDLILDQMRLEPTQGIIRVSTGASWAAGTLTINLPGHTFSATNNKVTLEGFTSSGAAIDGVYSFALDGSDRITVSLASDPGTISEFGTVRSSQAITSAVWSSGQITFTRAAHGRRVGEYVSVKGATSTSGNINMAHLIVAVTTDTYTVNFVQNVGTIQTTNAISFLKYSNPNTIYHLRPYSIIGESTVVCQALFGDSTTQTVGQITDDTRLCGVLQKAVGERYTFVDLSNNVAGLVDTLANPSQQVIKNELARRYCQGITFGWSKNDESSTEIPTLADWTGAHDEWWDLPVQTTFKNSPVNIAVVVPSRGTQSVNGFSTVDGQRFTPSARLVGFQNFIRGKFGSLYSYIIEYASVLTVRNQPQNYKADQDAVPIVFTSTAGSAVLAVDASTTINPSMSGKVVWLPGTNVGSTTGDFYVTLNYLSPTSFFATGAEVGIKTPVNMVTAVTGGNGIVGARKYISSSSNQVDTIHESVFAISEITNTVALKP